MAEKVFKKIIVLEQRRTVGGVWNYTPDALVDETFEVPQTDPTGQIDKPQWLQTSTKQPTFQPNGLNVNGTPLRKYPVFPTPMYETLETNIPHHLMRFSDKPFADDVQLFPKHETVLQYKNSSRPW